MMRKIVAVLIGLAVAVGVIALVEWIDGRLYPLPDLTYDDRAALTAQLAAMPLAAKLIVALETLPATFAGAWLALRICDRRAAAWIIAGLVMLLGIANLFALPQPLWMVAGALLLPWLGAWLAIRAHVKPYPGEALLG